MAQIIYQILFFFGLVTVTIQRQRYNGDTKEKTDNLMKLLSNLKSHTHEYESHEKHDDHHHHHHAGKHTLHEVDKPLNIHTLNLIYNNRHTGSNPRTNDPEADDVLNRICKKNGKCCNGECKLTVDGHDTSDEEITELLDELEKELTKIDSPDTLRCGCGKKSCSKCGQSKLRCGCGGNRADDGDDWSLDPGRLRCSGERCGGDDRRIDDLTQRVDEERCDGYRCSGRTKTNALSPTERYSKKYKLTKDLDAVVVDLSNLDGLLDQRDFKVEKVESKVNYDKRGLMGDLSINGVDELSEVIRNVKAQPNVEAVIVDLSQVSNNDDLANYLKTQFSPKQDKEQLNPEELAKYYLRVKRDVIELLSEYVYGRVRSDKINFLPSYMVRKLNKLKSHLKRGYRFNSYDLLAEINKIVFEQTRESKVLPHRETNNNVYIPSWVHGALFEAKTGPKNRMLPMTIQPKRKHFPTDTVRRASKKDAESYGIPFDMQIDGLGQVNP